MVAYQKDELAHIMMIEAKGVSEWDPDQLARKVGRVTQIFGRDGCKRSNVRPYLILMSPQSPATGLANWAEWMP